MYPAFIFVFNST